MNEILVEEENTVYELDPECLRHKEEQRQLEEKEETGKIKRMITIGCRRDQKKWNQNNMWIICLLLLVICQ